VFHSTYQEKGGKMLKTAEERVKLLKAGFDGKTIEMLYIKGNNIKIVLIPTIFELAEIEID
jgi:hypothetical protein